MLLGSPTDERLLPTWGGIANFTYLPRTGSADATAAFSTGHRPGNTLLTR
jgi:anhydro-N-acetylmuramic acid kinase